MKLLKHIALGLFLALSTAGATSAFAYEEGRVSFSPADAIDNVSAKIKEAQDAIANKADGSAIADLIKEASDLNKEINANDKIDRTRQKLNLHLKKARNAAKSGKLEEASEHLNKAAEGYPKLKSLL